MNENKIKEALMRRKLQVVENIIARTSNPSAEVLRRRDELKKELKGCDTKRQAQARALWHSLIEKRTIKECR